MQLMLIESKLLELIPERYADTAMQSSQRLAHWETITVSEDDYQRYEDLRIELDELIEELREKN